MTSDSNEPPSTWGYLGHLAVWSWYDRVAAFVPTTVVILFFLRAAINNPLLSVVAVALSVFHFAATYRNQRDLRLWEVLVAASLVFALIFAIINYDRTDGRSLFYAGLMLSGILLARHYSRNPADGLRDAVIFWVLFVGWFLTSGLVYGYEPNDINFYIPNGSRNGVALIANFLTAFYMAMTYRLFQRLPLFIPALAVIICSLSFGRAGIIVSALLLLLSIGQALLQRRWTPSIAVVVTVFGCLSAAPLLYLYQPSWAPALEQVAALNQLDAYERAVDQGAETPLDMLPDGTPAPPSRADGIVPEVVPKGPPPTTLETNFERRGIDSPRWGMALDYLRHMDLRHVIFGGDLEIIYVDWNGNPHNSYVRGHSYFGLSYFLYVAVLVGMFIDGLRRRQFVFLGLALLVLARAFIDTYALPGDLDFVVLAALLLAAPTPLRGAPLRRLGVHG